VKRSFHPNLGTLQGPAIGLALLFLLAATPWLALIWLATWLLHRWLPEAPAAARRAGLVLEVLGVVVLVFAAWFALAAVLNQAFRIGPYLLQLVLLQTLCVVGAYEYLLRTRKARRESHALQLSERLLAREVDAAHLQLLQAQVEPHFLFNTLAHLRRLASTDVAEARAMLGELLQVLAEALPSMREAQTPLSRELQLVRAYLGLHQRRMGESRLQQRFEVAPGLDAALLPSTTLLTLVENAVKHGLAPLVEGGEIAVRAEAREGRLLLEVADTGRGMGAGGGHGTGLANLRARLKALHGDAAELSLHLNEPRGLVARVRLPLT
jgi:sensor histidine kinase YesM